jgi:hypothetical protein
MNEDQAFSNAAANFVKHEVRERFVHEARKKPAKLIGRIAHDIESVFQSKFRDGGCSQCGDDECLILSINGRIEQSSWRAAQARISQGGGGILVIDASGRSFVAQSEGFPPKIQYGGSA